MPEESKKLSIAVIQQTPDIGGAETYMLTLMTAFRRRNHKVRLATDNKKFADLARQIDIPVKPVPVMLDVIGNWKGLIKAIWYLPFATWFYLSLLKQYKQQHVDLVFMSGFSEKMLVTILARYVQIPVVWLEHGPLKIIYPRNFGIPKLLYSYCSRYVQFIITPSVYTKNSLVSDGGIRDTKIHHIPDGVLVMGNIPKLTQATDVFLIGNVSRLTREKGQQYLIAAMPEILKAVPHAKLILIGAGLDKQYFQSLITEYKLEQFVTLKDYVKDVNEYYRQMDVFVFPTVWDLEGFGLVSLEAMNHKLPVIASDFGPVPEIVEHQKTGLLVKPHNAQEIAKAVIKLAHNKPMRREYGENGYKKVISVYNSERVADEFISLFYQALL